LSVVSNFAAVVSELSARVNIPLTRRLLLLSATLGALALLIGWSAFASRRNIAMLRSGLTAEQIESFRVADQFQTKVLKLDADLREFQNGRHTEAWNRFEDESRKLDAWLDQQRSAFTTAHEKAALAEIDAAYDEYRIAAQLAAGALAAGAPSLDQFARAEVASQRLLSLGLRLAGAHREALSRFVASTQRSLALLQSIIFVALLALVVLGAWLAVMVYREMIAPLRVKLIESGALIERQEKLASLGVLAAGVAHEIRNPLTAIKARLFMQTKALPAGSSEWVDAEFIGREIDRLEKIVRDFLRFARPPEPQPLPLSPAQILNEVRDLMMPQLNKSDIDLCVERTVATRVQGDPEQLKQVLINLVQNAAEAIGNGGTITLRAVESRLPFGGRAGEVVVIEVEDNGPGIPPEVQERLFDPFFTTKQGGTGLGLSIAARIIEKHGGALRFQSQMNHGTTFGIVLPVEL
jgi:signal transduction histidine kinase